MKKKISSIISIVIAVLLAIPFLGIFVQGEKNQLVQESIAVQTQRAIDEFGAYAFEEPTSTKTEQEHLEALSLRAEEICTEKFFKKNYDTYYVKIFYNVASDKPQFFQIEYDNQYLVTGVIEKGQYYEMFWMKAISPLKQYIELESEKIYFILRSSIVNLKEEDPRDFTYFLSYKKDGKLLYLTGKEVDSDMVDDYIEANKRFVFENGTVAFDKKNNNFIRSLNSLTVHKREGANAFYRYYIPEFNSVYTEQEHIDRIRPIAEERLLNLIEIESSYVGVDVKILYSHDENPMYFMVTYKTDGSTLLGVKIPEKYDIGIIVDNVYYLIKETDENDRIMKFSEVPDKIYYSAVNVFAKKINNRFMEISGGNQGLESIGAFYWSFEQNYFSVQDKPNPTVADAFDLYQS